MPELVALEWEHEQIVGVRALVTPGRVQLRQCFVIPQISSGASGEGPAADWLKSAFAQNRIPASGETLVALPRDEAFVRRLELPETPDAELPAMVRFQMGAKSSVSIDEQYLDFLPLLKRSEMPGREVLAATVGKPVIDAIRQQCGAAGLNVSTVGLTPVAVAELVARAEAALPPDRSGASLIVGRHGNRLEISVFRAGNLLFSHSARLNQDPGGTEPQSIVPEVSRALVALRGAIADVKIERAWTLVGRDEQELLTAALQRRLSCEVQPLDPFGWVELDESAAWPAEGARSLFAGPVGMLLARAESRVAGIDFLNPRKTVVKRDNRRQRLILAGVGAGTLAATLLGAQFFRISTLESDVESLQIEESELKQNLKKGQPAVSALALVEKWQGERVDWLGQLQDLADRMPARDRIYVEKLTLATRSGNQPARIVASGFAREQKDLMELASALHTSDRYRVQPHEAKRSNADTYYPWRVEGQEIYLNEIKKADKVAAAKPNTKDPAVENVPDDSDKAGDKRNAKPESRP